MENLTVLSYGAGQDSTYILYRIIRDPDFRRKWVKGKLIVVMSDTGNEHGETYEHVEFTRQLCAEYGIPFFFLTADMGFHPRTWQTLTGQFTLTNSIMSKMFPRACTSNLKIVPFYNFLNWYIQQTYYVDIKPEEVTAKRSSVFPPKYFIKRFVRDNGNKIRVILGIAAGEEKRVKASKKELKERQLSLFQIFKPKRNQPVWAENCVEKVYPMMEEGIDRFMAQQYILVTPWPLPPPSNCIFCPFKSKIEVLWLYRNHPGQFGKWVELEGNKIRKFKVQGLPDDKNFGVNGTKLLPEFLAEAVQEYGHLTLEELEEYRMSHGHCVMSSY